MKLIRLVEIRFEKEIISEYKSLNRKIKAVEVNVHPLKITNPELSNFDSILIVAKIGFEGLPHLENNLVKVPDYALKIAEEAIETLANFISISTRTKKSIISPEPSVAFLPENDFELNWLNSTNGISLKKSMSIFGELAIPFAPKLIDSLLDRLDGLALLAESINHEHPVGKYREFIRIFERGFSLAGTQITGKLSQFLGKSPYGYTKNEVESWINLRNAATHADKNDFILERDVQLIIRRMEQSAYEVVFNKLKWRDRSSERRQIYVPSAASIDLQENIRCFVNTSVQMRHYSLDSFNSYFSEGNLDIALLPYDWWIMPNRK